MKSLKSSLALLAMVSAFQATSSTAALITWGTAENVIYSTPTQVSTTGTYFDSFTYFTGGRTVNSVSFNGFTGSTGTIANFAGSGASVDLGNGSGSKSFAQINSNASNVNQYAELVARTGLVQTPTNALVSFTGLTVGYTYQIQLWQAPWDRAWPTQYSSSSDFTTGVSGNVTSTGSAVDGKWVPQFIIGTFTAGSSFQSIYFRSGQVDNVGFVTGPAAGQLRITAVPEPSSALMGLGVLAILLLRRRRKI